MSDNQNGSSKKVKWPKKYHAEASKALSNFFVGQYGCLQIAIEYRKDGRRRNDTSNPRSGRTRNRHGSGNYGPSSPPHTRESYHIMEDSLRKAHPVLRGRYCGEIERDFRIFQIGMILNGRLPNLEMNRIWIRIRRNE